MCSMMECVKYSRCRPLCPIHYEVMVADPDVTALTRLGNPTTIRSHHYSCARTACRLNYSPDLGYFFLEENDDYWHVTRSASLRIRRSPTQVLCVEQHKSLMYLESVEANGKVENFRCPQQGCHRALQVRSGAPPAYWLGEGFSKSGKQSLSAQERCSVEIILNLPYLE